MTKSRSVTGSSRPKTAMRTVGSKSKRSSKVAFAPKRKSKKDRVPSPSPSSNSSENDEDSDAMDVDAGADADDVPNLDPVAALAVGHLILDDPTHRMYQQHVDSLLNASDSVRFEELVQHLRRKGEELGMPDGANTAVTALTSVYCERIAGELAGSVLSEDMLAEVVAIIVRRQSHEHGEAWDPRSFLESVRQQLGIAARGIVEPAQEAEATQPRPEQVDTLGQPLQARTRLLSPSRAPYQHEQPVNPPVASRPVIRGAVVDTVDVVPDINLIAKGVDLYWDLDQLRAANMDAARSAISSTVKRARDLFCINKIAEAEYEANMHHPFVFNIQQLCDQAVLDWMQLPHTIKERWFGRYEKLLEGDVRTEQQALLQPGNVRIKSEQVSPAPQQQVDQPQPQTSNAPSPEQQVRSALLINTSCPRTAQQMEKTCVAAFVKCGYLDVRPHGPGGDQWLVLFRREDGASKAIRRKIRAKKQTGSPVIYQAVDQAERDTWLV
ncbi:hypothetical protein LTR56_004236 [Elasticomyces elasticus]|nr:hypothetical protein LTR56_004236 [Elasticomyces elasticus]KAK3655125.1 hypothetical protein LTR22_010435 [Elasticomyces elasticus]KAK4907710.1 hypothetical protein LTR49_023306 [Elasticomyces elasticus]KAK5750574.1 hypothetical protein LTS12_019364 [Elasticomyces elasticus]